MQMDEGIQLSDALPLMPRETAISYIIRLAAYYGCRTPEQFCKDMGIRMSAVLCGQQDALSRLARVTGASEDELCRWSIRGKGSSRKFINNQDVYNVQVSRRSWKFCPLCARQDVAASPDLHPDLTFYVRAEWQSSLLDICVEHQVKLVHYRVRRRSLNSDLLDFLSTFAADLDQMVAEPCLPDSIDRYVHARLTGSQHAPVHWLDDLPLCDAVSLACGMGAAMGDIRGPWVDLAPGIRAACGEAGLAAFAGGEPGLLDAMHTIRQRAWADRPPAGCVGRITRYFNQIPSSDASVAVGKALAQAAFKTFPFLAGEKLFGVKYGRPILLRSLGARLKLGITHVVWKDLLVARPTWVAYSDGNSLRTLIDIEAAELALRPHLPFVKHSVLAAEYGLSNHDLPRLIASGVVLPNGIPGLAHRRTLACAPSARAALDGYFARVRTNGAAGSAPVADNDNLMTGHISVLALSKRYGIEVRETLALIQSGQLVASKLPPSTNPYDGIGIDPIEAMQHVYGVQDPMTSQEVRSLLQLHNRPLDTLVNAGFLNAKTRKFVNGKMSIFERAEVDRFRNTYVTFPELVKSGICRPGENLTRKWRAEVVPAYHAPQCTIYFRSHFQRVA